MYNIVCSLVDRIDEQVFIAMKMYSKDWSRIAILSHSSRHQYWLVLNFRHKTKCLICPSHRNLRLGSMVRLCIPMGYRALGCYDFKNILSEKFGAKIWELTQKYWELKKKIIIALVFKKKCTFFRWKLWPQHRAQRTVLKRKARRQLRA
jgi:hypothetical protein